jgi:hypothetical protein
MAPDDNVSGRMTTAPIPTGMDDLTAEWLTEAIGPRFGGGTVTAVERRQIGTGQIADSVRLALTWDPPGDDRPSSLVAKVTSGSETSRQAALSTRTYEVEVGFYSTLADRLPVRRPACHWTGFDASKAAYGIVLEDLAPAEQGDQMRGCSVDEAALAVDELALLHGPFWGRGDEVAQLPWITRGSSTTSPTMAPFLQALLPGFFERYADRLTPEVKEMVERVVPKFGGAPPYAGVEAVVHGDYRNDNLMFGGTDGRVCVLDWQTVSIGPPVADLSYFLGGSLLPDDRRNHERELLERYCGRLKEHGVELALDDCLADYRRFAFSGLNMAIFASMMVGRTDRGDEMFIAMADRAGLHALDYDSEGLLG